MYIRKRSFLEIVFPLTILFFVCIGTSFIDDLGAFNLRWAFVFILFLYLFLNKKLLIYIHSGWKALLLIYLIWCISTTLWSVVPFLSFSKSTLFAFNIITLLSAGSLWLIKFGYERSLDWLFLVLISALLAGFIGGGAASENSYGIFSLYSGLLNNSNAFGFLMAVISPLILLKLHYFRNRKWLFFMWLLILITDAHFLVISYSRSAIVIFLSVLAFFSLSLPLSKKILITLASFFFITIFLIMMPVSYMKVFMLDHVVKIRGGSNDFDSSKILQSRYKKWQHSIKQAKKGGVMGGGFAATIGDNNFTTKGLLRDTYGREKGNSQLGIMEETGIIGLLLYALILISFFYCAIPTYLRLQGSDKVAMGTVLGAIVGLLAESLVEGWWDSAAGPEVICFWTFVGIIFGMIYMQKRKPLI